MFGRGAAITVLLAGAVATGSGASADDSSTVPQLSGQWGRSNLNLEQPATGPVFIANTLHRNFALFEKYPNYVFNFSGSRRYEMMKEYYPQDYEKLKTYIAQGRWFPCGSSVDENDANVPSAESQIRHVLYGNHYFRDEFGSILGGLTTLGAGAGGGPGAIAITGATASPVSSPSGANV